MEIINDNVSVDVMTDVMTDVRANVGSNVRYRIWDNGNLLDSTDRSVMISVQNHVWNSITRRVFSKMSDVCKQSDLLKILKYKDSEEILRISQPRGDFRAEYGSERGFEMMSVRNSSKRERRAL